MTMKYRFRTSKGYVYLEFDLADFEVSTYQIHDRDGKPTGDTASYERCNKFTITEGEERINQLYCGGLSWIMKYDDGSLWAIIELSDGYYGSPEYLLEQVE